MAVPTEWAIQLSSVLAVNGGPRGGAYERERRSVCRAEKASWGVMRMNRIDRRRPCMSQGVRVACTGGSSATTCATGGRSHLVSARPALQENGERNSKDDVSENDTIFSQRVQRRRRSSTEVSASSRSGNVAVTVRDGGYGVREDESFQRWRKEAPLNGKKQRTAAEKKDNYGNASRAGAKVIRAAGAVRAEHVGAESGKEQQYILVPIRSEEDFDRALEEGRESKRPVVIDWMAQWCRKCIYLKPKLEKLSLEYPKVKFYEIDVNGVSGALVKRAGITKMPTIQIWKDGEKKAEVLGGTEAWIVMDKVRTMIKIYK